MSFTNFNFEKKSSLEATSYHKDRHFRRYSMPILSTIKCKFLQKRDVFEVPEGQRIHVMQYVLRDEALWFFTKSVVQHVSFINDALNKVKERFIMLAHNTTKLNTPKFNIMKAEKCREANIPCH